MLPELSRRERKTNKVRIESELSRLSRFFHIRLLRRGERREDIMTGQRYDRSSQDLGNLVNLGHVNFCITDQHLATYYYISGLGLTRDPFLNTGPRNMWVNVG